MSLSGINTFLPSPNYLLFKSTAWYFDTAINHCSNRQENKDTTHFHPSTETLTLVHTGVGQNPSRTKPPRIKPLWDKTPLGQNPPHFMKQYYTSLCYVTFVLNMDTFIVIVFSLVQIVITARPVSKSPSLWHGLWRFQCKCGYRVPLLPF